MEHRVVQEAALAFADHRPRVVDVVQRVQRAAAEAKLPVAVYLHDGLIADVAVGVRVTRRHYDLRGAAFVQPGGDAKSLKVEVLQAAVVDEHVVFEHTTDPCIVRDDLYHSSTASLYVKITVPVPLTSRVSCPGFSTRSGH